ncbi:MAG: hypothetical protein LC104_02515 [Bacteroidales bacterium]|nr:hypothetical protein [Bacteroidales bacterium]
MKALQLPTAVESRLMRMGWSIVTASGPDAARVVARDTRPTSVVLLAPNGVLTCAKLAQELPDARIVIIGPDDAKIERFARFAGATEYVSITASSEQLLGALTGEELVMAC